MVLHERYRDRQLAAARLEAELAGARLDALRTQLQPHFLFNSLHSIASLARAGDTAGVVRLIAGFSELLRSLLEQGERHLPLADELRLVERYLEIQCVRFADRLQAIGEADALNLQVALDQLQFVGEREMPLALLEQRAQQLAEPGNQADDPGGVAGARQRRDAVQAVEEEVRLQLRAQRVEPRAGQLRLELRRGDLRIAVAPVQHDRRAGPGDGRVDQQLEMQPPAHLADHRRPESRDHRGAEHGRQRRDRGEVRQ